MRLVLITDVYPPLRSSGAVQLRDLSIEFVRQGHDITVLVASPDLSEPWTIESWNGVRVMRVRTPKTKDVGYIRRTIGELLMPFYMRHQLKQSPLKNEAWEGVVWYSPTIFLGPIAKFLKTANKCRSYLVIRDIFPEWAVDMGLMGRGLPYLFFKTVAKYQYAAADVIGIQTQGNSVYFSSWLSRYSRRLEVLQNWLADSLVCGCRISVRDTKLAGRKIFVYAGNMGVAQGMDVLLNLACLLQNRSDVGFVFVGRGSDAKRLRLDAQERGLNNVLFFDEIEPDEIPGLYSQCHVGLVALDPRHKTHNIPGKFLSYMQSGLPVLASVNAGNDIVDLIRSARVGRVCTSDSMDILRSNAEQLIEELDSDSGFSPRCKQLADRVFAPSTAVRQIVAALRS
ncbi:glycosyltransferase family 4 protein [Jeongeupia naejangsanensis]|uniref:Glycosyltransferase family 4 protein n=1 Tax=Jeongeupia naejangsanensis TaxID=613195 RepID=A0ABS2BP25_9NEIS|nr:glycosyltransferase family 4 protein [Jeongeupia naejangsanensis]MBM3117382.1 glycosyltransferase family 4 protein [Jeongeupia naejangsanensis]